MNAQGRNTEVRKMAWDSTHSRREGGIGGSMYSLSWGKANTRWTTEDTLGQKWYTSKQAKINFTMR